jgi:hypothetical protein
MRNRDRGVFHVWTESPISRFAPATKADLATAREARRLLATPAAWNAHDTRDCPADTRTFSFFCGLVEASESRYAADASRSTSRNESVNWFELSLVWSTRLSNSEFGLSS